MVGVPGRSKGCSTCRQRKKKCDLLRPACDNCIRGGYVCGGYERNIILVNTDHSGKGTYKPINKKPSPHPQRSHPPYRTSSIAALSESLNRTSLELEYFDVFWSLYLPKSVTMASCESSYIHRETKWVEYTSNTVPRNEALRCALLALSTSKVGRNKQDIFLIRKGIELYGKALSLLAKELKAPGDVKPFEVLNCCRLLAIYEQMNDISASAQNWKGHVRGLLSLVRLHPPEVFSRPGTHELFLEARYNGVTSALLNRKASFLSWPEWMTEPWNNRPKDAIDMAMDVLVKMPGILEEWDILSTRKQTQETLERVRILKNSCLEIDTELRAWYSQFISSFKQAYPNVADILSKGMNSPAQQVDIPDILERIGLHYLYAMTIYWTCCAILYATLDLIYSSFPETIDIKNKKPHKTNTSILKYCICIGLSAKYFLRSEVGLSAALSVSYAGTCLIRTLFAHKSCYPEVDQNDVEQLRKTMGMVRNSSGYDTWKVWKNGMDDLNYSKSEVLDRYAAPSVDAPGNANSRSQSQ